MLRIKTKLNYGIALALVAGLVFFIGCGGSQEKQQMTQFIQKFHKTVDEYVSAGDAQKAELAPKIEDSMAKWTDMKIDMASELTPQVLDELDSDFQESVKKFKNIAGKS
jgi:hypothetical protein